MRDLYILLLDVCNLFDGWMDGWMDKGLPLDSLIL